MKPDEIRDFLEKLPDHFIDFRLEQSLTQVQFAQRIGVYPTHVTRLERQRYQNCSLKTLREYHKRLFPDLYKNT